MGIREWATRQTPQRLRRSAWMAEHPVLSSLGFGTMFGLLMWLMWGWWTIPGLMFWLAVGILVMGPLLVWIVRRSRRSTTPQAE